MEEGEKAEYIKNYRDSKKIVRMYLTKNELVEKDKLINNSSKNLPENIKPFCEDLDEDECIIILGALIDYLDKEYCLENSWYKIAVKQVHIFDWNIYLWINDELNGNKEIEFFNPSLKEKLKIISDTVQFLIPYMAGSNVSYLADGITYGQY